MNIKEIISAQKEERRKCIDAILSSKSKKKIILAGAGTGKTYTFREVLKANSDGNNIALTFINSLTADMNSVFGNLAEVKTFHAYCKKILHEQNGKVELFPYLTQIIEEDAVYLGLVLRDFDKKFQILHENPITRVDPPKMTRVILPSLTSEQVDYVIASADNARERLLSVCLRIVALD